MLREDRIHETVFHPWLFLSTKSVNSEPFGGSIILTTCDSEGGRIEKISVKKLHKETKELKVIRVRSGKTSFGQKEMSQR
jgi:hypothetical protein